MELILGRMSDKKVVYIKKKEVFKATGAYMLIGELLKDEELKDRFICYLLMNSRRLDWAGTRVSLGIMKQKGEISFSDGDAALFEKIVSLYEYLDSAAVCAYEYSEIDALYRTKEDYMRFDLSFLIGNNGGVLWHCFEAQNELP